VYFSFEKETSRPPSIKPEMNEANISLQRTEATAVEPDSKPLPRDFALGSPGVTAVSVLQRVLSFPMMLVALLVAGVFVARRDFNVDPDVWWHLKIGEDILRTHHWPTVDPYSFTVAGQPWFPAEWLGDVLFAAVDRIGGLQGLEALLILLGASIVVALYAFSTLRCGNSKAGFVASAALMVLATASFSLRPQMLGFLFLVVTLLVLERYRQGKTLGVWFLPVLFLLWANTHGSFVAGITAIAVYWVGGLFAFRMGSIEARRWSDSERIRMEVVFLLCLLALTVTPYGGQLAIYPFQVSFTLPGVAANVVEWQPMPFDLLGGKWFLVLLLGFLLAQMTKRFNWRLEEVILLLFGTTMACFHARFLLVFVPCFAPFLATVISQWVPAYDRAKDRYALNAILMITIVAGMIHYFPATAELESDVVKAFPVQAVKYLRQHPVPLPMFNTYNFGGYLLWADEKVFIDGRFDPYKRGGALEDYFQVTKLQPRALAVLRGYGVRSCLLQPSEPLATMLGALPEWQLVYADELSVLFVRRQNAALLPTLGQSSSDGKE
jgi:hypothetical protein